MSDLDADKLSLDEHMAANGWIRTWTGLKVTPLDLKPEMVNINDIAHALARICRFGGHVAGFVSVGRHSIEVAHLVEQSDSPEYALEALMHDAAEAYLGDLVRPLKKHPLLRDLYLEAEANAERVIADKFRLVHPWPAVVMEADNKRLMTEMKVIRDSPNWFENPPVTEKEFIDEYDRLSEERWFT